MIVNVCLNNSKPVNRKIHLHQIVCVLNMKQQNLPEADYYIQVIDYLCN